MRHQIAPLLWRLEFTLSRLISALELLLGRVGLANSRHRVATSYNTPSTIGKQTLKHLVPAEPVIVEVGAHYGFDTEELALIFPNGRIFAFEAHPSHFAKAYKRLRYYPNVSLVCCAVCATSGVVVFNASSGASDASGSILRPTNHLKRHERVHFLLEDRFPVVCTTLDDFLAPQELPSIDLLWMDVQGAEMHVLEGSQEMLGKVKFIYLEVSEEPLYEHGTTYQDLRNFLQPHGFAVMQEFLPQDWNGEGNVLFGRSTA